MARLNRPRLGNEDVEEGEIRDESSGYNPQFFRFKWGTRRSLELVVPASEVSVELLKFVAGRPPRCTMAQLRLLCLRLPMPVGGLLYQLAVFVVVLALISPIFILMFVLRLFSFA